MQYHAPVLSLALKRKSFSISFMCDLLAICISLPWPKCFPGGLIYTFGNCRYSVQCEPGQILSYTIKEVNLENPVYCSNREECVDWVDIVFNYSIDGPLRFCGREETSTEVFIVGTDKMDFKFVSNRYAQARGFWFVVQCADSNLGQQNESVAQSVPLSHQYCSRPCCSKPLHIVVGC